MSDDASKTRQSHINTNFALVRLRLEAIFIAIVYVKWQPSELKWFGKKIRNTIVCHKSLHMDETRLLEKSAC